MKHLFTLNKQRMKGYKHTVSKALAYSEPARKHSNFAKAVRELLLCTYIPHTRAQRDRARAAPTRTKSTRLTVQGTKSPPRRVLLR